MRTRASSSLPRAQHRLVERLERALAEYCEPGDRLLAAVSGGGDSMALLDLLALTRRLGTAVAAHAVEVAYVDHGLRREASREAAFVEAACGRVGMPFHLLRISDPAGGDENHLRRERYELLHRLADAIDARWIVTAHTFDDQAETMLLRLFRGAGRRGLSGMTPVRGRVLRPLLDLRRDELRRFLGERGAAWMEDASNDDPRYARNRLRHGVVPAIEEAFGGQALAHLPRMALRLRQEEAFLAAEASRHLAFVARRSGGTHELDLGAFASVPAALRSRVLGDWLASAGVETAFDMDHLQGLEGLTESMEGSASLTLPGVRVEREYGVLRLAFTESGAPEIGAPYRIPFDPRIAGACRHPGGRWRLLVERGPHLPRRAVATPYDEEIDLDLARIDRPLVVRATVEGDRIALPSHRRRHVRDLLGERRVPRRLRCDWPVLTSVDDEVLWVPGVARAASFAVSNTSGAPVRLLWHYKG